MSNVCGISFFKENKEIENLGPVNESLIELIG